MNMTGIHCLFNSNEGGTMIDPQKKQQISGTELWFNDCTAKQFDEDGTHCIRCGHDEGLFLTEKGTWVLMRRQLWNRNGGKDYIIIEANSAAHWLLKHGHSVTVHVTGLFEV